MTRLLEGSGIQVVWLDICQCQRRMVLVEVSQKCPCPLVIQNNYIVGLEAKLEGQKSGAIGFLMTAALLAKERQVTSALGLLIHPKNFRLLNITRKQGEMVQTF